MCPFQASKAERPWIHGERINLRIVTMATAEYMGIFAKVHQGGKVITPSKWGGGNKQSRTTPLTSVFCLCVHNMLLMSMCLMSRRALCSQTWLRCSGPNTATSKQGSHVFTVVVLSLRDSSNSVFYALQRTQSCHLKGQFSSLRRPHSPDVSPIVARVTDRVYSCVIASSSGRRIHRHANYAVDLNPSVCLAPFTSLSIPNQRCRDWLEQ